LYCRRVNPSSKEDSTFVANVQLVGHTSVVNDYV
jgi:hypothetical protein